MPKISEGQATLGGLALLAIWLFVLLPLLQCAQADAAPGQMEEATEYWTVFGHHLKITDTLLAAFTFFLFVATLLLFSATKNLVLGAEQTADLQLRAYVMVEHAEFTQHNYNHIGSTPKVALLIKNYGQTPAHDLTHWTRLAIDTFPVKTPIDKGGQIELAPRPLAPGDVIKTWAEIDGTLNLHTCEALRKGTHAIYVVGEIRYTDAFGKKRETDFLLFGGGSIGTTSGEVASYVSGNRIT